MSTSTLTHPIEQVSKSMPQTIKSKRVLSVDLVRGTVMIIMALDHVRDYFHQSAFLFSPTDLSRTSVPLFFTRWITHFCAPVFVFLAGISAFLYGSKKSKAALSVYLFKRGLWLVFAELFIITLEWTFNPTYPVFNFQVIWAIGVSMIVLSVLIRFNWRIILVVGLLLIAGHNLLDPVHVAGKGLSSLLWDMLHQDGDFTIGRFTLLIHYPVLPWIGIMATGYCFGNLYTPGYDAKMRKRTLLILGSGSIILFILLRSLNLYGDPASWSVQQESGFTLLSFLNVTKYPPSLLYCLMTLGPALIFLALAEMPLNALTKKITVFGRVPMFYYLAHIFLIHLLAIGGVMISGRKASDMILANRVNRMPGLRGYGFDLQTVYLVWFGLIVALYPLCRRFDRYKRANQSSKWWLSYL